MDSLPGLWSLTPLGALLGVLVVQFLLYARGAIISKSSHLRELAQANLRGDEWKDTAMEGRRVIEAQALQINKLIESARISDHFYRSVNPAIMDDTVPNLDGANVVR